MAKEKARYFTFLLYPESIPNDWELKLEMLGVPMAISPLHDKDKSNVEGQQYKKPHYHVLYIAKNPVTADSVRWKIKKTLGEKSLALVQVVLNVENTYLYLTHESKDAIAKKKHVYDRADIKLINNFDIDRYVTLDVEEKGELFNVVVSVIRAYMLENIFDLYDFVEENGEAYGFTIKLVNEVIAGKTGFMKLLFDGAYQRRKRGGGNG
ncbi:TPA: replication protein [Streptococcus pyogenes]|uniref:RepB n=7 Tax=Bacteria TaxID=2 RepID=Q14DY2_STREQ|nr:MULTISPECIES: replication protein [Streptococcus]MCZ1705434.1 replication protein [Enterococcus faecium]AAX94282.1 RepB [Streptococcus dysgalactiae subsp. equisimilis]VGQ81403.1 Plasmid replication protein [Streptococcus pyogenes]VHC96363.1 Plasmid replication protein [Streptococcus pyogenes]HEP1266632.1 replication protein [Streptococcus pyogenes]